MTTSPSQSQNPPQVRLIVACPHSGSTLVERVFAASTVCAVTTQCILTSGKDSETSILEDLENQNVLAEAQEAGKRFVVCRKELGGDHPQSAECFHGASCSLAACEAFKPVILISDPIRIFDMWKKAGWNNAQTLVNCYVNMFRMLQQGTSQPVASLVYEQLVRDPAAEIKRICHHWNVPLEENLMRREHALASAPTAFADVDLPWYNLLSNAEKDEIEEHVGRLYLNCWKDDIQRLRAMLTEKTWFGFDLDDTLHEFRRSSGKATRKVLEKISVQHDIALPALEEEYTHILKEKTANAFSDGKTSFDYRRERFASLLIKFSLAQDSSFLAELLDTYESTLKASLEWKCGSIGLLSIIKEMGKKIVIMTEGPQDAQERAVKDLGIEGYIDFLATTNYFGVTKIDGLFHRVLKHLSIAPDQIAYVGDNEDRDMKPAMAEGILCIHLAESKHTALDAWPPRVNTLRKLQYILSDEDS